MAKRILITEDERPIADLLSEALSREGYETRESLESLRFFDNVRDFKPDLILLDILMPYLDGRDELRLISMHEDTSHIPIIVVTADENAKHEEDQFRQFGVVKVVPKPFDINDLISLVRNTIGDPQGVAS